MLIIFCARSQNQANYWYFGENAGISFSSGTPVALIGGQINTLEGCSAISSSDGELLFYSDGSEVWDNTHTIMPNGYNLMGNYSSTQSAIIVPNPVYGHLYYIFTVDAEENNLEFGLRYSVVDMTLNNGLGDVTDKKNILLVAPICEKVTAVGHGTENKTWVITHLWESNAFHAYHVHEFGVNANPVISNVGDTIGDLMVNSKGYLKVSPDGTKLVMANNTLQTLLIFDFDNETGEVSNQIRDDRFNTEAPFPYGIEFSPNSELLYVTNWSWNSFNTKIFQYDLTLSTPEEILDSRLEIASYVDLFGALQLGPDNRIYVAQNEYVYLGIINDPNTHGANCDYQLNGVFLAGMMSRWGLPPFIQSFFNLNAEFYNNIPCIGNETQFYENCSQTPDSVLWNFGDMASGPNNYSALFDPVHIFSATGLYNVTLTAFFEGHVDSVSKIVNVYDKPQIYLGNDTAFCIGDSFAIDAGAGYTSYLWQNGDTTQSISIDSSGIFWVEVSNDYGCTDRDSIMISANPVDYTLIDTSICQGQTINIGGEIQSEPGTYYDTLKSVFDCDSIIITNLNISDTFSVFNEIAICEGDSLFLEGEWQSEPGTYNDPFISLSGCDSIVITQLSVNDTFEIIKPIGICTGDSIWAGGAWQFQSGIFYDYELSAQGCDSTIITELTVDTIIQLYIEELICQGDSFFTGGAFQVSEGMYYDSAVSVMGCDSFTSTQLLINEVYAFEVDTSICEGDSIFLENAYRYQSGIYEDNLISVFGCDSIISTALIIEMVPSVFLGNDTIVQTGTDLILDAYHPDAIYLWQDGSALSNFVVYEEGLYHVIVTGNCGSGYDSIFIDFGNFNCKAYVPNAFTPDGDGLNDVFIPRLNCDIIEYELNIFDRWGSMVFSSNDKNEGWDGAIDNEIVPMGVYAWVLTFKVALYEKIDVQTETGVVVVIQ
ncbi:MAG: gliding motility-associated C-terminal domain-containing protein [Bacteroidota bacterium]|nr:gliding motility-associated C-terminal domain-containing protein [Bacteroidota bacterium]